MPNLKLCAALVAIPAMGCVATETLPPDQADNRAPATVAPATPKTFRTVNASGPNAANAPQLMNDGTVLVQDAYQTTWWKLTPDANGDYAQGAWTQLAPTPTYSPLYYAQAILPDGRMIVEGGEYEAVTGAGGIWTTKGAIYDPAKDQWKSVSPPAGWSTIGDASGMVLPDGTFLLSDCCTNNLATLNADTLTWHNLPDPGHQSDSNDEESWALLWDNTILTVDSINAAKPTESERLDLTTMRWSSAGSTIVPIADNNQGGSFEEGPILLRPDGVAVAIGTTAHTSMFNTATMTWTPGPDMPLDTMGNQLGSKDGPGAMLPNGDIFLGLSPSPPGAGSFPVGVHFFEFDGTTFKESAAPPGSDQLASYLINFLVLPTGEIMVTTQGSAVEIYTPSPGFAANAIPTLTSAPHLVTSDNPDPIVPESVNLDPETGLRRDLLPLATIHPGRSYKISGIQLNGIGQGAYYGDDEQSFTNRPIFRVQSMGNGHVKYLNAHHSSSYGITPDLKTTTFFDVPNDVERGVATLTVVANGVASVPVVVNIK